MSAVQPQPVLSLWAKWQDPAIAEFWGAALGVAEQALRECAAERSIALPRIESRRWDAPAVTVTWQVAELHRNVQVLLESPQWPLRLAIRSAVWSDTDHADGRLERRWANRFPVETSVGSLDQLARLLAGSLPGVFAEIEALVPETVEWITPPLAPQS